MCSVVGPPGTWWGTTAVEGYKCAIDVLLAVSEYPQCTLRVVTCVPHPCVTTLTLGKQHQGHKTRLPNNNKREKKKGL